MKKYIHVFQKVFVFFITTVLFYSCSDDNNQMVEDNFALNAKDLQTVLETYTIIGAADNLLTSLFVQNGATGKSDSSNDCYTTQDTDTGYILTFVTCNLDGQDVRGVIEVTYDLESEIPSFTATYSDFYINETKIDGSRVFLFDGETNGSNLTFSVTSDMDLVLADGTLATENGTRFFGFIIADSLADIAVTLNGDWNLTVGNDLYTAAITDTLETKLACDYISKGQLSFDKNGLTVLVDFGDGTCDSKASITYPNGVTQQVSLAD